MNITKVVNTLNILNVCYRSKIIKTVIPYSSEVVKLLRVLCDNGFISGYLVYEDGSNVCVYLRYHTCGRPALVTIRTISTAGRRVLMKYCAKSISRVYKGNIRTSSILMFLNGQFMCVQTNLMANIRSGLVIALLS